MNISCECGRVPAGFSSHEGTQSFSFLGFSTPLLPPSSLLPATPALPLSFHEVRTAAVPVVLQRGSCFRTRVTRSTSQDRSALLVSRGHLVCMSFGFCWMWLQDQDGICKDRSSHLTHCCTVFFYSMFFPSAHQIAIHPVPRVHLQHFLWLLQ